MTALIKKPEVADRTVIKLRDAHGSNITELRVIERIRPEGGQIDFLTEKVWDRGANSQLHTIHTVQDLVALINALVELRGTYQ